MADEITAEERDRLLLAEQESHFPKDQPAPVADAQSLAEFVLGQLAEFTTTVLRRHDGAPFYRDPRWIPPKVKESLEAFLLYGQPVGSFLEAVLSNDLKEAAGRADEINYLMLGAIVGWLYEYAPANAWGDETRVVYWQRQGGWNGAFPQQQVASLKKLRQRRQ